MTPGLRRLAVIAAILTPLLPAAAQEKPAISFRLRQVEDAIEGPTRQRLAIQKGDSLIAFRQPQAWRVSGTAERLSLVSDKLVQAPIEVKKSPLNPTILFKGTTMDQYLQDAEKSLPEGAADIKLVKSRKEPFPINDWSSVEFILHYLLNGQAITRRVAYINLDSEVQVVLTAEANDRDFEEVMQISDRFMHSWYTRPQEQAPILN